MYKFFETTFEYIDSALSKKESILVHCAAGASRSPTIIIAYLIKKQKIEAVSGAWMVKRKRSLTCPNVG
jgi:protein-tyrosine phosphatase